MRILFVYLCACVSVCVFMCVCVCIYARAYFLSLKAWVGGQQGQRWAGLCRRAVFIGFTALFMWSAKWAKNNPLILFSSPLSLFAIHAWKFFVCQDLLLTYWTEMAKVTSSKCVDKSKAMGYYHRYLIYTLDIYGYYSFEIIS